MASNADIAENDHLWLGTSYDILNVIWRCKTADKRSGIDRRVNRDRRNETCRSGNFE